MGTRRSKAALKSFLRFSGSSVICFLLDYGLFTLLNSVLLVSLPDGTRELCATYGARIVSAVTNFSLNRLLVFQDKSAAGQSIWRYAVLAVVQASQPVGVRFWYCRISQMQQTCSKRSSRSRWTACSSWRSYQIQKRWVFRQRTDTRINKKIPYVRRHTEFFYVSISILGNVRRPPERLARSSETEAGHTVGIPAVARFEHRRSVHEKREHLAPCLRPESVFPSRLPDQTARRRASLPCRPRTGARRTRPARKSRAHSTGAFPARAAA